MFERLIRAPDSQKVPSTALSIQRRMRKNICDLVPIFRAFIPRKKSFEQPFPLKIPSKNRPLVPIFFLIFYRGKSIFRRISQLFPLKNVQKFDSLCFPIICAEKQIYENSISLLQLI
jgi:hypothetical protein